MSSPIRWRLARLGVSMGLPVCSEPRPSRRRHPSATPIHRTQPFPFATGCSSGNTRSVTAPRQCRRCASARMPDRARSSGTRSTQHIRDRNARLRLLQRKGDLFLREPALLHGSAPPIRASHNRKTLIHAGTKPREDVRHGRSREAEPQRGSVLWIAGAKSPTASSDREA